SREAPRLAPLGSPMSPLTPATSACAGSRGVDGSLRTRSAPSPSTATTSVKVPPVSTPTRMPLLQISARGAIELLVEAVAQRELQDALTRLVERLVRLVVVDHARKVPVVVRVVLGVEQALGGRRVDGQQDALFLVVVEIIDQRQRPQRAAERLV